MENVKNINELLKADAEGLKSLISSELKEVTIVETKKGNILQNKNYELQNEYQGRATLMINDESILRSTERIQMAIHAKGKLTLMICKELANLNKRELLDKINFRSIGEYAHAMFDLSKNTANQYARIGELFINDEYKIKSQLIPQSLNSSHLLEFLRYIPESGDLSFVEEKYADGTLTDGMSSHKIRAALKQDEKVVDGEVKNEETLQENVDSSESESSKESSKESKSTIWKKETCIGRILSIMEELESKISELYDNTILDDVEVAKFAKYFEQIESVIESKLK